MDLSIDVSAEVDLNPSPAELRRLQQKYRYQPAKGSLTWNEHTAKRFPTSAYLISIFYSDDLTTLLRSIPLIPRQPKINLAKQLIKYATDQHWISVEFELGEQDRASEKDERKALVCCSVLPSSAPRQVRADVWEFVVGDHFTVQCGVCTKTIRFISAHLGHKKSAALGGELFTEAGKINLENVIYLCDDCNGSMGTQHFDIFRQRWYPTLHLSVEHKHSQTDSSGDTSRPQVPLVAPHPEVLDVFASTMKQVIEAIPEAAAAAVTRAYDYKYESTARQPSRFEPAYVFFIDQWPSFPPSPEEVLHLHSQLRTLILSKIKDNYDLVEGRVQLLIKDLSRPGVTKEQTQEHLDFIWCHFTAAIMGKAQLVSKAQQFLDKSGYPKRYRDCYSHVFVPTK